jgi:hypothetical protein
MGNCRDVAGAGNHFIPDLVIAGFVVARKLCLTHHRVNRHGGPTAGILELCSGVMPIEVTDRIDVRVTKTLNMCGIPHRRSEEMEVQGVGAGN